MNYFKTGLLLIALTLLLVGVGHLLGGPQGATMAFVLALVMNAAAYWFSDRLVLAMYRARPVSEAEAPDLHRIVRGLAQSAKIPMPKVYRIPHPTPNAFATGRDPAHAAVAVTDGILRLLSTEELTGVLAHELGHVRNRDILISTIAATIAGAIMWIASWARYAVIFGGGRGGDRGRGGVNPVAALALIVLAPLAATLVQLWISRTREYAADEAGARLSRDPLALANALEKLERGAQLGPVLASAQTAHLFIVNPLRGDVLASLFSTHPPLRSRIERLRVMARLR